MKNITVSVDEETHRSARVRAAELGTSVSALVRGYLRNLGGNGGGEAVVNGPYGEAALERRRRMLDDFFADLDARGVGLRTSENLTRDELYGEAIDGPDALR